MNNWQQILVDSGGPFLKDLIKKGVGGGIQGAIAGKVADIALEALAEAFGTEANPEAIGRAIEADPVNAPAIVQSIQSQFVSVIETTTGDLSGYIEMLREDQKNEGLLTRIWRPLFAIVYTVCFGIMIFTVCWLLWNDKLDILMNLTPVTGFLTFTLIAGAAVLGIQIQQREKTERMEAL